MIDDVYGFDAEEAQEKQEKEMLIKSIEYKKLVVGTFNTDIGLKYLDYLEKTHVNIPMYTRNTSIEEVSYRQAKADLIRDIRKEINDG